MWFLTFLAIAVVPLVTGVCHLVPPRPMARKRQYPAATAHAAQAMPRPGPLRVPLAASPLRAGRGARLSRPMRARTPLF